MDMRKALVWFVAFTTLGSGLVNIYSVIGDNLPERSAVLEKFFPLEFLQLSRSLVLVIGFALVISSVNIYKRKRRAFWVVAALACLSILFHLTKGIDYEEASLSLALLGVLFVARRSFTVRSSLPDLRLAAVRAFIAALVVTAYGVAGFWLLDEMEFGINFHIGDAFRRTVAVMSLVGNPRLAPQTRYAAWFADSLYMLTFTAIAYAGLALFRPVIYRFRTLPQERARAAKILEAHGRSSLDYFKLWSDKSYYFSASGNSFLAYAVGNSYAMALADPVGVEEEIEPLVRAFVGFCQDNDWSVAFHQTLPDLLPVYQRLGFRKLKIGDEATVDLTRFSLEGKEHKKLRSNVNKFEKEGVRFVKYEPPIADEVLRQARAVSDDWLRIPGRRERTFSLGLFDLNYIRQTPLVAALDKDGRMVAFANRIPSYRQGEATIDLMRHQTDAPNGTMDYLFTKLCQLCKEEGYKTFSLGLAPLTGFTEHEQVSPEERAVHFFLQHLNFLFSYAGLRQYKAKFADSWEPRYLIYQNVLRLPQVALTLTKVSELKGVRHR
ncbi:MAG: bifunctional lysylphosphatidylglycerol flippase/synthetase MprF [Pyrinomonadaceae bacterium]|nr:bifunctional lysylphosphatidylglycerol flippase/synthetase MprF [Pyrinomonadaceae bacterium]